MFGNTGRRLDDLDGRIDSVNSDIRALRGTRDQHLERIKDLKRSLDTWAERTQLVSNDLGKTDQRVACLEGAVRDLIDYLDRQAGDRARTGQEDDLCIAGLRRNFPPAQKPEDDDVPF